MAEIEITLPTVQFGNVKVRATPEELDDLIKDADRMGIAAALYLNIFTQGFKAGSQMDVSAPVGASQEAPTEAEVAKAAILLDEGLGGVTEVPAGDIIAHENAAPWAGERIIDKQPKPWETGTITITAEAKFPTVDEAW